MSGLATGKSAIVGLVVVGLWAGVLGMAQGPVTGKRPMAFADLMAMKRVSDPQVSPSGKWVMFSVTDVSLEKNTKVNHLWVVPLDGSRPERQVTSNTGESFGRFSPDGKFVSYTGEATKDDPVARITIAAWDEKNGTIGVGRTLTAVSGDADGAVWSPDSKHFLFTTEVWPECSVKGGSGSNPTHDDKTVMNGAPNIVDGTRDVAWWKGAQPAEWADEDACDKAKDAAAANSPVKGQVFEGLLDRHWDHYTGQKRTHILEGDFSLGGAGLNSNGNNVRDLTPASAVGDAETPTFFVGGQQNYAWAPDSKEIAYVTNLDAVPAASTNNDVFTLRLDEPGAKAVKVSTSPGSDDEPEYSPDGKWLAFRSQARAGFESDTFRLMLFDREKKAINEVVPKFDRWVDEFAWNADSKMIYVVAGDIGRETILHVSVASGDLIIVTGKAEYSEINVTSHGSIIVSSMMTTATPTEIVSLDEGPMSTQGSPSRHYEAGAPAGPAVFESDRSGALLGGAIQTQLTHINGIILSQIDLPKLESFWFAGAEGTKVEGFLLKPPGFDPAKKYPIKFLMHGGPQTAWGDSWSYRWNWELMAASGYVVIGINRRGSTGYGQKFVNEVSGDWGGRAYEDLMKGLDYAEAHFPFIDKTRECALGASYGGFMADWVLTHTDRFKCIVTHDGMFDPVSAYGSTEEMWFNEWEFRRPEDFPKGWDGFTGGYDPVGHPMNPTHDDKAVMNGAPKVGGAAKTNTGILTGGQNDEVAGDGHPAEPWRYAALPADQDPFRKWSPMRFIENAKTPTLVIHSQKDYRLDVSQGFELFTALQRRGVPSKMLYFPDEGHWVQKPQNAELWNATVSDWCDRWTHTGAYADTGAAR